MIARTTKKKIGSHKTENKIEPMMDLFASQTSKKNAENANAGLDVSKWVLGYFVDKNKPERWISKCYFLNIDLLLGNILLSKRSSLVVFDWNSH